MKIENSIQNLYKYRAERAYIRYLKHLREGQTQRVARNRAISDVGIDIRKERDAVIHLEKIINHVVSPPLEMIKQEREKIEKPYRGILRNGRTIYPVYPTARGV